MKLVKCINKRKFKLTAGKTYEVEAELFNLDTMETYAVEIYDDKDKFIEVPIECIEVVE